MTRVYSMEWCVLVLTGCAGASAPRDCPASELASMPNAITATMWQAMIINIADRRHTATVHTTGTNQTRAGTCVKQSWRTVDGGANHSKRMHVEWHHLP